ncbi:hypothetical protein LDG_6871 [Legionella drancourtii LLAP12]|uniref:Uncharacterized protein n=1 Tax=Legionella drancourtii LLAP12 TaxID=658187 RepID=G9ENP6_9GAMM|nr:hypothetical protein LDG_6871 [Legionella drancourtii LLAP12]
MLASRTIFAVSPSTGQLVIVNKLGNGTAGLTQSSIKIEVYDFANSTQPCTTVANLPYNGVTIVRWAATGVHRSTFCTGTGSGTAAIYQVKITPLQNIIGQTAQVVYDATTHTPQAVASPIIFTPPTIVYGNMALVINGTGTPNTTSGQTADQTHWGFTVNPTTPVFDTGNGAVLITGIPGVAGAYGLEAEKLLRSYGIIF